MDNNTNNNNKNTDIGEDNQENSNEFNPEEKIKKDTESVTEKESHLEEKESHDGQNNNEEVHDEENNGEEDLVEIKNLLSETKDKLLRTLAENENIRKQMDKQRLENIKYGVQPLAREIVNVLDNFNRALDANKQIKDKAVLEGFVLIQKEIVSILEKFSINKVDALNENFDANFHQAMFEKPSSEFSPGKVCEIIQDGYTFHDRLLRPALVGVAVKEEKEGSSPTENQDIESSTQDNSENKKK